jgi:hypothetical protein
MLTVLLDWGSKHPKLRRPFMQLYRRWWRVRRATLAKAVLIIQNNTGGVLALPSSGPLRLPFIDLHARDAITTQVEARVREILNQYCNASLIAIDGTPGPDGVTFLYGAAYEGDMSRERHFWFDPDVAVSRLSKADSRLLRFRVPKGAV